MSGPGELVHFRRNRFVARFPRAYRYSPAHFWMGHDDADRAVWRVGLTHFATRMLGEIVEFEVEKPAGGAVEAGEVIGWIEGMKAVTDLFCVLGGELVGSNPTAGADAELVCKDPYGAGWLYAVRGEPGADSLDVDGYLRLLGETIDEMEKQPWKAPGVGT